MAIKDLLFSVAEELAKSAKQPMPLKDWQNYLRPGRVLTRGGIQFPLRKDEVQYGALGKLGSQMGSADVLSPDEMGTLLHNVRKHAADMPKFQTLSPERGISLSDTPHRSMHYANQYQLPGPKLGQSEELTVIPNSSFVPSTAHFGAKPGLLSWSRTTRRPVLGDVPVVKGYQPSDFEIVHRGEPIRHNQLGTVVPYSFRDKWHPDYGEIQLYGKPDESNESLLQSAANHANNYKGQHADEVRSGETAQHIEEIQSDWHQRARKEGYRPPPMPQEEKDAKIAALRSAYQDFRPYLHGIWSSAADPEAEQSMLRFIKASPDWADQWDVRDPQAIAAGNRYREAAQHIPAINAEAKGVPQAPYKDTYAELELKKNIAKAIDQGDSYVTWTTGDQQADRWGQALRNTVDELHWKKTPDGKYTLIPMKNGRELTADERFENLSPTDLEDTVGRDIAKRIVEGEGRHQPLSDQEKARLDQYIQDRDEAVNRSSEISNQISDLNQENHQLYETETDGGRQRVDNLTRMAALARERDRHQHLIRETSHNSDYNDLARRYAAFNTMGPDAGVIDSDNLTIGGRGMRKFYDRDVPAAAKKLADQYGGELTKVKIPGSQDRPILPPALADPIRALHDLPDEGGINPDEAHDYLDDILNHVAGGEVEGAPPEIDNAAHRVIQAIDDPHETPGAEDWENWHSALDDLRNSLLRHTKLEAQPQEVHALRLTPRMVENVKKVGLPLFSAGTAAALGLPENYSPDEPPAQGFAEGGLVKKIMEAALRHVDTGNLYKGATHGDAMWEALNHLYPGHKIPPDAMDWTPDHEEWLDNFLMEFDHGFLTNSGEFLDRHKAAEVARRADQLIGGTDPEEGLHAGDYIGPDLDQNNKKYDEGGLVFGGDTLGQSMARAQPLPAYDLESLSSDATDPFWWLYGRRPEVPVGNEPNELYRLERRGDTGYDPVQATFDNIASLFGSSMRDLPSDAGPVDLAGAFGNDLMTMMTGGGALEKAIAKPAFELWEQASPIVKRYARRLSPLALLGMASGESNFPDDRDLTHYIASRRPYRTEIESLNRDMHDYASAWRDEPVPLEQSSMDPSWYLNYAKGGSPLDRLSPTARRMHEALYRLDLGDDAPPAASGATGVASVRDPIDVAPAGPMPTDGARTVPDRASLAAILGPVAPIHPDHLPIPPHPDVSMENDMRTTWAKTAPAEIEPLIQSAATAHGVPVNGLRALLEQESAFNPRAVSPVGAQGIAQFMPATAKDFGIDPLDPTQAIPAAARYLRTLYDKFGDWDKALAAYNWGQGNVQRKGMSALPKETADYVANLGPQFG